MERRGKVLKVIFIKGEAQMISISKWTWVSSVSMKQPQETRPKRGDPGSADGSGKPGKVSQSPQYIVVTGLFPSANTPGCNSSHPQKKNIFFCLHLSSSYHFSHCSLLPHHSSKYFSVSTSHFSLEGSITSLSPQPFLWNSSFQGHQWPNCQT